MSFIECTKSKPYFMESYSPYHKGKEMELKYKYHGVSDTITIFLDDEPLLTFDDNFFEILRELLNEVYEV